MKAALALPAAAVMFALLATANSGGYRFGISDQAFYEPAIVKVVHPEYFPRDSALLATESRLMLADKLVGASARALGVDLPPLFFAVYLLTLFALTAAAVRFGRAAGLSWWAIAALLLLMTFRHRIAKTGANSLEGYMHLRELAFALGVFSMAAVLQGRFAGAAAWIAATAVAHPTTAVWFAVPWGVSLAVARPALRRGLLVAGGIGILVVIWTLTRGPLAGRLVTMDPAWLAVLAGKDYLFPTAWPAYAWAANLAYPIVIFAIYRSRLARGLAVPGERAFLAGLAALVIVFLISVPLTWARLAIVVQMQVTRVFWLLDFVTAAYLAWWLTAPRAGGTGPSRRAVIAVGVLALASAGRAWFQLASPDPPRRLVQIDLPATPWDDAMRWLRGQPSDWHVLADPGHAWKYGTSVRVAAEKDVLLEAGKDTALAMYDRNVAMRIAERQAALNDYDRLTTADVRALARQYDLTVMVARAGQSLELPVVYRNPDFVVYDLR